MLIVLLVVYIRFILNYVDVNQKNYEENSDVKDDESDDDEVGDGIVEYFFYFGFIIGEYCQIIKKLVNGN